MFRIGSRSFDLLVLQSCDRANAANTVKEEHVKRTITIAAVLAALLTIGVFSQSGKKTAELKSQQDSLSYIIGYDVGEQLRDMGADLAMDPFMTGVQQAIGGDSASIDPAQADTLRQGFAGEVQQKMEEEQEKVAAEQEKESEQFLSRNRKRKGVKVTPSGLQYRILEKGKGPKPNEGDSVRVSYKGMLIDSTIIDSTMQDQPAAFDLESAIPGLQEGIKMMNVGSEYRFFIPAALAYGETGIPPVIPPNAALIFDVKLVGIGAEEEQKPAS